jgi:hypothetical protein
VGKIDPKLCKNIIKQEQALERAKCTNVITEAKAIKNFTKRTQNADINDKEGEVLVVLLQGGDEEGWKQGDIKTIYHEDSKTNTHISHVCMSDGAIGFVIASVCRPASIANCSHAKLTP